LTRALFPMDGKLTVDRSQPPLVSVIMNCLNCEKYLREAIDSVFAQTYSSWEIIFWDNASTDCSGEIARSYGSRVRYFRGDETVPLGAARDHAVRQAQGEYVALLDCDDVWLPRNLAVQMEMAQARPDLGMVYTDCFFIDSEGRTLGTWFSRYRPPADEDVLRRLLTGPNFIPCLSVLMRTAAVRKVGGFNHTFTYSEEYDLFLRLALEYQVAHIAEPLAKYRLHDANATGTGNPGTTRETIQILKQTRSRLSNLPWRDRLKIQKRLWELRAKLMLQSVGT
jgi:glycosyltransferase involved in cell wall biosynthesis